MLAKELIFFRLKQCFLLCFLFGAFSSNVGAVFIYAQVNVKPMALTENQPFLVEVFVPMCQIMPDEDVHYTLDGDRLTIHFKFDAMKDYTAAADENGFVWEDMIDEHRGYSPMFFNSGCVGPFDPPSPNTAASVWRHYKVPVEGLSQGLYTVYLEAYAEDSAGNVTRSIKSDLWAYFQVFEERILLTPDKFDDYNYPWTPFYEGPAYKYNLETPKNGVTYSGIGLIRGWACKPPPREFTSIRYQIDDRPVSVITHGASRKDTAESCFGLVNNGFNTIVNWNSLGEGEHSFKLFFDNELVYESTFHVASLGALGTRYRKDLDATYELKDFPVEGSTATIQWQAEAQNFVIVDVK